MKFDLSKKEDLIKLEVRLNKLKADGCMVDLKKINQLRSLQANKYLHVVLSLVAIEMGYSLDEVKVHLKRACNFMVYEKNGEKFLRHTSKMQSDELTKFIEWVRTYSSVNLGAYIPTADEYKYNMVSIDNEIERHKEFL